MNHPSSSPDSYFILKIIPIIIQYSPVTYYSSDPQFRIVYSKCALFTEVPLHLTILLFTQNRQTYPVES